MEHNKNFHIKFLHQIEDPLDDNIDAIIYVENKVYTATFFTLNNVKNIMDKWILTGECSTYPYFYAVDCLIVHKLDLAEIEMIVSELIDRGELDSVFTDITENYKDFE